MAAKAVPMTDDLRLSVGYWVTPGDAVPDEFADMVCLLGPVGRIRERLERRRQSPVTTLLVAGPNSESALRAIRDAVLG